MYNANNTGDSNTRPGLFDVYRGDFADNGVVNDFVEVCEVNYLSRISKSKIL